MSRTVVVLAAVAAAAALSACDVCLPGQPCMTDGPSDDTVGTLCTSLADTPGDPAPICGFAVSSCDDGNQYDITCDTATACECRRSNADGTVDTTQFTIAADCTEFSTSDSTRFAEFAAANCGWNLTL